MEELIRYFTDYINISSGDYDSGIKGVSAASRWIWAFQAIALDVMGIALDLCALKKNNKI